METIREFICRGKSFAEPNFDYVEWLNDIKNFAETNNNKELMSLCDSAIFFGEDKTRFNEYQMKIVGTLASLSKRGNNIMEDSRSIFIVHGH